jgi:hypothetical protein
MNGSDVISLLTSLGGVPEAVDVTQVIGQVIRVHLLTLLELAQRGSSMRLCARSEQPLHDGVLHEREHRVLLQAALGAVLSMRSLDTASEANSGVRSRESETGARQLRSIDLPSSGRSGSAELVRRE